jgi:hypothetical protein|tara:strand:+ start:1564 stop:2457 length:894 start_codon:yes stop_codon:yes gene_type:complete
MTEQEKNEDINFDSMDEEQLEKFINSGGETSDPESDETSEKEETEKVSEEKKEEEVNDESDDSEEPEKENQEEETEESNSESAFYKGKNREDLIEMIDEQNRHISRQGNEIGSLRKIQDQVNDLESEVRAKPKKEEDDLLSSYDSQDIQAIELILDKREKKRLAEAQEWISYNKKQNEIDYQELQNNTELFEKVSPLLDEKFESSGKTQEERIRNTLETDPGWLKKTIFEVVSNNFSVPDPKVKSGNDENVKRKKSKANSINNTKSANINTRKFKSEPDDPNEYIEYLKERGITISA